jgi:DNA-binding LytR/AlgR family response regulator
MRIVVCDDELAEVQLICQIIREFCEERQVSAEIRGITDYKDFLQDAARVRADIVVLDIFMGKYNGMDAARILRQFNSDCALIFVTSSEDYALEAFAVTASHYLLKPVTREKLAEALGRTRFFRKDRKCLHVNVDYVERRIPIDDIEYMETVAHKTRLHLRGGGQVDTNLSLMRIAEQLQAEDQFIDCYRGIVVNADYIDVVEETAIILQSKREVPIARKRYGELHKRYGEYLFRKMRSEMRMK